ncbi:hypothetical protein [Actinoplanes sp. NBRC 101535]|uniref:hypothetical protein n=1 Tax=Actinoplanes sp. NBRC 101535 TaxID=3032196 RepID=UPI0024A2BE50|nr:hypothetical protein [Actinoplanes sp. NBRC 101535]GLY06941.1 hypothetical protein Acsp01_73200 [Actinoplanes sp. NBRC 101535]
MNRTLLVAAGALVVTPAVALILTPGAAQADDRPPRTVGVSVTVDLDHVPWRLDVLPPGAYPWVWPQGQTIVTLGG